ncbi:pyruvate, phosphate dikinase regulatory protein, chloroplastic [Artemisia annua]|uniref:Pyruvate, phosphate dikinase regulatory protein, chloroplastic n=1 Tax=Artemisia annua TaxID=35608 RepID=A0A2U1K9C3_ARTAN|nr:pyruvate, phosphate dikinase regulatory protein, chloroplastic [Artemisia annua]
MMTLSNLPQNQTPDPNNLNQPKNHQPSPRKLTKGSSQLLRWSRARAIRSGVKLDQRPLVQKLVTDQPSRRLSEGELEESDDDDEGCLAEMSEGGKHIYMVSDGTGWTAEHSVNAALGQFEHCLVDHACAVNTHLFSGVFS